MRKIFATRHVISLRCILVQNIFLEQAHTTVKNVTAIAAVKYECIFMM